MASAECTLDYVVNLQQGGVVAVHACQPSQASKGIGGPWCCGVVVIQRLRLPETHVGPACGMCYEESEERHTWLVTLFAVTHLHRQPPCHVCGGCITR